MFSVASYYPYCFSDYYNHNNYYNTAVCKIGMSLAVIRRGVTGGRLSNWVNIRLHTENQPPRFS
jgi:hypothetical protein